MKKNKAAAASGGDDLTRELPDALLHHVLSFLPVDEAVQTSVLARRWLHLWKDMPVLRLASPKKRFPTAEDFDSTFWRARFGCSESSGTLSARKRNSSCLLSPST
nr:unnamed protein product [Digitaria exilis]